MTLSEEGSAMSSNEKKKKPQEDLAIIEKKKCQKLLSLESFSQAEPHSAVQMPFKPSSKTWITENSFKNLTLGCSNAY